MNGPMTNRLRPMDWALEELDGPVLPHRRLFRARSRWHALRCALGGLRDAWLTQPNLRIHVAVGAAVLTLSVWLRLSALEWLWVSFAVGIVIFAELMNTAIEQTVDMVVGLRLDLTARRVKDLAASFVLVACLIAAIIGAITFGPHLLVR